MWKEEITREMCAEPHGIVWQIERGERFNTYTGGPLINGHPKYRMRVGHGFRNCSEIVSVEDVWVPAISVRADEEYVPDDFWAELRKRLPRVASSLEIGLPVYVTAPQLETIESLPSWNGGPAHAPHPLIVNLDA